jgi:hypothetical protein
MRSKRPCRPILTGKQVVPDATTLDAAGRHRGMGSGPPPRPDRLGPLAGTGSCQNPACTSGCSDHSGGHRFGRCRGRCPRCAGDVRGARHRPESRGLGTQRAWPGDHDGRCRIRGSRLGFGQPRGDCDARRLQDRAWPCRGGRSGRRNRGGLRCHGSQLTIRSCIIEECSATASGGGIFVQNSAIRIEGCSVRDCSAYPGGGIWASPRGGRSQCGWIQC